MDNLAHTLVGASLADAGLKRLGPLATATLLIGANLPDVDGTCYLVDADLALGFRRGWTHGVLALAVWPFVLTAAMLLADRVLRRRHPDWPRSRGRALFGLSAISVLSHPLLDWLNSYGVRLLMPFDGRWFYGDALFIMDPWVWLMAGAAVVAAHSHGRVAAVLWLVLALPASAIALLNQASSLWTTALWVGGIAAILLARQRLTTPRQIERVARGALLALTVYIAAMVAGSRIARAQGTAWFRARGITPTEVMAGPLPGQPLQRDVLAVASGRYYFAVVDWQGGNLVQPGAPPIDVGGPTPVTEAALRAPGVRGLRTWLRYPAYRVEPRPGGGYRVTIVDVRYARQTGPRARRGFGWAVVELDARLQPVTRE